MSKKDQMQLCVKFSSILAGMDLSFFIKVLSPVKIKQGVIALLLPLELVLEVIVLNGK